MRTVDRIVIAAPLEHVFQVARDVERWPAFLPHYRRVRFLTRGPDGGGGGGGTVEMAAWRPFGLLRWPTWWVSEMTIDSAQREIRYRHVRGITRGMDVTWRLRGTEGTGGTNVELVHTWDGPGWPLIGRAVAAL